MSQTAPRQTLRFMRCWLLGRRALTAASLGTLAVHSVGTPRSSGEDYMPTYMVLRKC
jgi:hypothetical protein